MKFTSKLSEKSRHAHPRIGTGLRDHGEKITLMLCPLEDLWRTGARDAKALGAFALYSGLNSDGLV